MSMFHKPKLPRQDLDFTDTITGLERYGTRDHPEKDDQEEVIRKLVSQVIKLTREVETHKLALFAYTDKNDFGRRGLWHQMDGLHRLGRILIVSITALAGFIGWIITYVLPIVIKSGVIK